VAKRVQRLEHAGVITECHRITGEDCFLVKAHLRSIDELGALLDRFSVYGETATSLINATPIPRRDPPIENPEQS
jgi:Lrp/AsnC family leucine-responsive transcriptional regulator